MGDLNVDSLQKDSNNYTKLKEFLQEHNLEALDIPFTRITPNTISSLDVCITNLNKNMTKVTTHHNLISDHLGVNCTLQGHYTPQNYLPKKNVRLSTENNLNRLKERLGAHNWESIYQAKTIDEKYNNFLKIIQTEMDTIMPKTYKTFRNKTSRDFWDDTTLDLKNSVTRAYETFLNTGRTEHRNNYTNLKKTYDIHIRERKSQNTINNINSSLNKSKEIWRVINKERKNLKPRNRNIVLKIKNQIHSQPQRVCHEFNDYFLKIGAPPPQTPQQHNTVTTRRVKQGPTLLHFNKISKLDLQKLCNTLPPKNSAGFDDISNKIMKHCQHELLEPLLHIINSSIEQATVPESMKISVVYPKFKKGEANLVQNYRPISVLPTFSKYLEKIINQQLVQFLEDTNSISPNQHGFRHNKSIDSALAQLCSSITKIWEGQKQASGIFLDLQKAFDSLDRNLLLEKLYYLNIRGNSLRWIESYLTNRKQMVEIEHFNLGKEEKTRSLLKETLYGVPQGSVLGPLLFLVFINDFPDDLPQDNTCIMFADDTTIIAPIKHVRQTKQEAEETISLATNTCNKLKLQLNLEKTVHIKFSTTNRNLDYNADSSKHPNTSDYTKFLGITLDKNLTWHKHLQLLHGKLSSTLFALRRIRKITNKDTTKIAYHALFASHLKFGIIAWGAAPESYILKIFILQKKALRIIEEAHYLEHCRLLFKNNKILTLTSLYILEVIKHIKNNNLITRQECHNHNTRNKSNYNIEQHRLLKTSNTPQFMGAKLFNLLPQSLKNISNKKLFIKKLKIYLLDRPYYTLHEFTDDHCGVDKPPD